MNQMRNKGIKKNIFEAETILQSPFSEKKDFSLHQQIIMKGLLNTSKELLEFKENVQTAFDSLWCLEHPENSGEEIIAFKKSDWLRFCRGAFEGRFDKK